MGIINKIVLLSDDKTCELGFRFIEYARDYFEQKALDVYDVRVRPDINIEDAVSQFDRIGVEIRPDLLIVVDFACIRMQSAEEEPMYNNMGMPTVHVLFRRPWEYEEFMIWRCNFTTRCYCMLSEDVRYIRQYYKRVPNVISFPEGVFGIENKEACYLADIKRGELERMHCQMPEYMKKIAKLWVAVMQENPEISEAEGMWQCLRNIGFTCSNDEYFDIMYMMRYVFALYYCEIHSFQNDNRLQNNQVLLEKILDEFLDLNFSVTLL